jgi:signal peptidase I
MNANPPLTPRARRRLPGAARLGGWVASTVAALIVVALLLTAGLVVAGFRPATDRSDSMVPYLHRGDVIFSRSLIASQVHVGDVITFPDPYFKGVLLTHRVRAEQPLANGRIAFTTRGDANSGSEHWTIAAGGDLTHVAFRVPYIGNAFILIDGHPLYLAIVIALALWLLVMQLVWGRKREKPASAGAQPDAGKDASPAPAEPEPAVALATTERPGAKPDRRGAQPRKPGRRASRHARKAPLLGVVAALAFVPTAAAAVGYVASQADPPTAPAVNLVINGVGLPLFNLTNMRPGQHYPACEIVTNQGPATADVGIYGDNSSGALLISGDPSSGTLLNYLSLTIARGTLPTPPANATFTSSCAGFSPDATGYGNGPGVIFNGELSNFPSGPDTAISDPVLNLPSGSSVAYEMTVTLGDNAPSTAQSKNAVIRFDFGANAGSPPSTTTSSSSSTSTTSSRSTTSSTTSTGPGNAPSMGSESDSASLTGNVTIRLKLSGKGAVGATATLVTRATKTKAGSKPKPVPKPILLGSGHTVATRSGAVSILIVSRRSALAIYRKHPGRYRISVTLRSTSGLTTPISHTVWLSAGSSRILAAGGHAGSKSHA